MSLITSVCAYLISRPFTFPVHPARVNENIVCGLENPRVLTISKSAELCIDRIPKLFMRIGNVARWSLPQLICYKWLLSLGYSKFHIVFTFFYFTEVKQLCSESKNFFL